MSIKEDLDDALAKKQSIVTEDKEMIVKLFEEQHQALEEYLKENDILLKLEEIVSWAKEKGLSKIISEHEIIKSIWTEDNIEGVTLNKSEFVFQIFKKNFLFSNTYYASVGIYMSTANFSRKLEEGLVPYWQVVGVNEGIREIGLTEEEMFVKIKEIFVNLIGAN